ncbi:hypothetical protein Q6D67_12200 [Haliea sp. E1-2-M8]|uniref:hypothetical protein n=1 Tax=Haliea sp. E1-2-M8 TaxID=3064706 RepID=UPI0027283C7B|nr:hypothetical protein [Haliea sp. E1-2-M8]MDO8862463.1 hypothetical protein [Haliea sp. E1-2-M8]
MSTKRMDNWQRLTDRHEFDYAQVPDSDLLSMKVIARNESAIFLYDGSGVFIQALRTTGLGAINVELWRRGLTPAQQTSLNRRAAQ